MCLGGSCLLASCYGSNRSRGTLQARSADVDGSGMEAGLSQCQSPVPCMITRHWVPSTSAHRQPRRPDTAPHYPAQHAVDYQQPERLRHRRDKAKQALLQQFISTDRLADLPTAIAHECSPRCHDTTYFHTNDLIMLWESIRTIRHLCMLRHLRTLCSSNQNRPAACGLPRNPVP